MQSWQLPFTLSLTTLAVTFLLPFGYLGALSRYKLLAMRPTHVDFIAAAIAILISVLTIWSLINLNENHLLEERLLVFLHLAAPSLTLLTIHRLRESEPLTRALMGRNSHSADAIDKKKEAPKPFTPSGERLSWDDLVIGKPLREELDTVITLLKNPDKAKSYGIQVPRGILLEGPPGTGKTSIAKVVAHIAGLSFFALRTDEIVSQWVGESEKNLTRFFQAATELAPSVIFIDEIDSIGKSRGQGTASHSENLLNHLLQLIDGISTAEGTYVIGATNRADMVDPALKRPGRLEKNIFVPLPNTANRMRMFELHLSRMQLAEDANLEELALRTQGLSGAEIKAICNQAGINAFKRESVHEESRDYSVQPTDLEQALLEFTSKTGKL